MAVAIVFKTEQSRDCVKPEVVVCGQEVVLRPRYHVATCISPLLMHLLTLCRQISSTPAHTDVG